MVGKTKASTSTTKSKSKQTSLLDLFPKRNASSALTQTATHLPQSVAATDTDNGEQTQINPEAPVFSVTDPIASTSEPAEIIDITSSSPEPPKRPSALASEPAGFIDITSPEPQEIPSKPPSASRRTASKKPPSSRSSKSDSGPQAPIVIDLTDPSPQASKIFSTAPKPVYHIFSRSGSSSQPKNHQSASQPSKPTYAIFNTKPRKPAKSLPVIPESEAPFPTTGEQHVRGPQSTFTAPPPRRYSSSEAGSTQITTHSFLIPVDVSTVTRTPTLTRTPASFREKEQCMESIPSEHKRDHPAIARLADAITSPPGDSEKLWSDRWRPRRADGVLGNEQKAVYLRDWLIALEIRFDRDSGKGTKPEQSRGVKRPQVVRSVTRAKKRRRQSPDDFIVSDASDCSSDADGPVDLQGDDDDDFQPPPGTEDPPFGEAAPNSLFKSHLTNTIILSGPSGTGKTAAVYSCAEELGWEVFEIYPGVGRRNGASLEALIGDVGKNHLVRGTQNKAGDFGFLAQNSQAGSIRQSLILIEEVDILFKEDANFWPALIRLIRDSRRPIVCTCNDIFLVPTSELPLQTTLEFKPCPPDVAGSYLQGLCCVEGHIVDRNVLAKVYGSGSDLRHSINCLQLLRQDSLPGFRPEQDQLLDWTGASRQSIPHADSISFVDAYMSRGTLDRPKALALTKYERCADDEMGFPILAEALGDGYGVYEWDRKMMDAVNGLSRGVPVARRVGVGTSADYQDLIDAAFRNNPAFPVGTLQRAAAYTEYLPLARQIIVAEDVIEARYERFGRATRNSTRYIRSIGVGEDERRALECMLQLIE